LLRIPIDQLSKLTMHAHKAPINTSAKSGATNAV